MQDDPVDPTSQELAEAIAAAARYRNANVATCESLTGGHLAAALTSTEQAGDWYRGGVVAYQPGVKHGLLRTPAGSVITAETATAMACSTAALLDADYTVAVTGVGGPEPQDGRAAGTVYIATSVRGEPLTVELHGFNGDPVAVMQQTIRASLQALLAQIRDDR